MRNFGTYIIFIAALTLCSCKKCLNKKGEIQSYTHELEPFNELEIEGKFNIVLVQGLNHRLTLEGYKGILETVKHESNSGVLKVSNNNKCSNINDYDDWVDIRIEMDSISYARFSVPGTLGNEDTLNWDKFSLLIDNCDLNTSLNVKMENFEVTLDGGTSTLNLSGKSFRTEYNNNGNGHIYGKNLISNKLYVYSIGTGLHVGTVTDYFETALQGSAQVHYYGHPISERIDITGTEGAKATKM